MKRILFMPALCLILASGCQNQEEPESSYELTEQDQSIYNSIMQTELQYYNWVYTPESIKFGVGTPSLSDEENAELKAISDSMGYAADDWTEGEKTATAAVDIYHTNGDLGGTARFFFKNNRILCAYYTINNNIYSLSDTSVFLDNTYLTKYENLSDDSVQYTAAPINLPFSDFTEISPKSGIVAAIENNTINFYTLLTNTFELSKSYSYADLGYTPLALSFNKNGDCAILAGNITDDGRKVSQKVIFLDSLLNPVNSKDFMLYVDNFHSILYDENTVTLAANTSVSVIDLNTGQNTYNHSFVHGVYGINRSDIYNDNTTVYYITDKTNLYVYSSDFTLLWRTYNSESAMDTIIHTADLNGDGIKEAYIKNTLSNSTYKYAVAKTGFMCIPLSSLICLPGDFDADSHSEYIEQTSAETLLYNQKP